MIVTQSAKKYYSIDPKVEWRRLVIDAYARLELDTTLFFLKKYLPKEGLILDAGGGPGRYSIILAKKGYKVVLLDLVAKNIEFAKKIIKKEMIKSKIIKTMTGSVVDLSRFSSNSFDAVLCLGGSLSHIGSSTQRQRAVKELRRVAKKNAPIFISVMGRFGTVMRAPLEWPEELSFTKNTQRMAARGDDYRWKGKYFAHYFILNELEEIVQNTGLKIIERVGLGGLSHPSQKAINKLAKNKKAWRNWLALHYTLCTHPSVVDTNPHFMVTARK